ncbi:MAG TPA: SCP2 sterol-binding domain-containing protein [Candidatus Thermoplasmatota archaeon]|nr:SCP2 sterol-binding domain-containing protein [Candidatus Thermoplasmatota archaeon]
MIATVEDAVKRMEASFWRRYNANPDLQRKLAGKSRIIQLAVPDAESYWFDFRDGKLHEIRQGAHQRPDVVVTTEKGTLLAVFNGEMKAMHAYLTGKVKVKASFSDILFAKSLIG